MENRHQLTAGTDTAPLPLSAIPIESPIFNSVDSTSAEVVTGTFGPQVSFTGEEAIEKAAWQLLEATSFPAIWCSKGSAVRC